MIRASERKPFFCIDVFPKLTLSSGPSTFESVLFVEVGERESRWHNLFGGRLWRKEGK